MTSNTWVPSLGLTDHHKHTITGGYRLSCDHIMAAQKLLKRHCKVGGLQDPGYAENPSVFEPQNNGAIQVHNTGTH